MISINTNLSSFIIQSNLKTSTNGLNQAIERMTTGFKLNHAKDNATNFSISTSITTKLGAYNTAEENAMMGLDMVQTASSSIQQMSNLVSHLRSLTIESKNGTLGTEALNALNSEASAIIEELLRIQNSTQYNGIYLLNGNKSPNATTQPSDAKFIKKVEKYDTTTMTKLSDVSRYDVLDAGTYSISTIDELDQLSYMNNRGRINANTEFVLANNIVFDGNELFSPIGTDAHPFIAKFNGNGYVIENLRINSSSKYAGLFGCVQSSIIKNVGLENVAIDSSASGSLSGTGGLIGGAIKVKTVIENCYTTGNISSTNGYTGGLVGVCIYADISSCYSTCNISGNKYVGGLAGGYVLNSGNVENSCFAGTVEGDDYVGGMFGNAMVNNFNNCYVNGKVIGKNSHCNGFVGGNANYTRFENSYVTQNSGLKKSGLKNQELLSNTKLNHLIKTGALPDYQNIAPILELNLQIGINDENVSTLPILFNTIDIEYLQNLDLSDNDALDIIDEVLNDLNCKNVSLGAFENRLMSAIESIGVSIDNLTSTQSTIRDADIANLSSEYIRNQILQQAAATLLATANQTPAIALQLL